MSQHTQQQIVDQINHLQKAPDLPFCECLQAAHLARVLEEIGVTFRDRVFNPVVTLWAFLSQALSSDQSCRQTVARVLAYRVVQGEKPCSAETGSYCKARQRLPEALLVRLMRDSGQELQANANRAWLWKGRAVKLVDGTTVSMPDTAGNQQEFPQARTQKPGLGFPIARLVAVISLACGAVLDLAIGQYQGKETGETALLRMLWDCLCRGDVLLADGYYASYFGMAALRERGVDMVTRMHHRRQFDFRRGRCVGVSDHIVRWLKPQRPVWLDPAEYARLPDFLEVRDLRALVSQPGFRVQEIVLVTTLLDPIAYSKPEVADLYLCRWHVELDLRSIKVVLQMDVLRCQTPEMVRKEIWAHLLAYNLIRTLMAAAAQRYDVPPRELSFKGTLQTLTAFRDHVSSARPADRSCWIGELLRAIASHRVGDRPGRVEPRAIKRRPKPHDILTVPRAEARKALLQHAYG
jgi:hypothetical protein